MRFLSSPNRTPCAVSLLGASLIFFLQAGCSSKVAETQEATDSETLSQSSQTPDRGTDSDTAGDTDSGADEGCPVHPEPAVCDEVGPAPASALEITDFAVENAVPLSCDNSTGWVWNFVVDSAETSRIIAMGEVHGSSEIGPASAALFTQLVEEGSVDTLALEMGMDLNDALESYASGDLSSLELYGADAWADSMFWRTLPDAAAALRGDGHFLRVIGVDVPWAMETVVDKLRRLADEQAPEVKESLLQGLPDGVPFGEDVYPEVLSEACTYRARIQQEIDALCTGLDDGVCLDIARFASGLCFSAQINAPSFWDDPSLNMNRWLADREKLIYANYLALFIEQPEAKVYAHMGGFHAGQSGESVGQMLAEELGRHGERLFSLWPAYGEGSAVLVDGDRRLLDPQPAAITEALDRLEALPHYLPIRAPGFDCAANPFFDLTNSQLGGTYGDGFDGFVIFPRLTPENTPNERFAGRSAGSSIRKKISALDALLVKGLSD